MTWERNPKNLDGRFYIESSDVSGDYYYQEGEDDHRFRVCEREDHEDEGEFVRLDTFASFVVKMYTPTNPEKLALALRFVLTSVAALLMPSSTRCVKPAGPKPGNTAVRIGISPRFAIWFIIIESTLSPVLVVVLSDGVDGA